MALQRTHQSDSALLEIDKLVLSCLDECRSEELREGIWAKYNIQDFVDNILERKTTRKCLSRLMAISGPVFTRVVQYIEIKTPKENDGDLLIWFFDN